jgi:hypothetical protein
MVSSNAPKKDAAKNINKAKKNRLNHGLVARALSVSAPNITDMANPEPHN